MVVNRFNQIRGNNFHNIFSQVVKMSFICVVLGLTTNLELNFERIDVKIVFLNGGLEEEIYTEQSLGVINKEMRTIYAKKRKSL